MTPVDLVGDSGGLLAGLQAGVDALNATIADMGAVLAVMSVVLLLIMGIEIIRGVTRR